MADHTINYNLEKQQENDFININGINNNFDILDEEVFKKVEKVSGKGLSTEDYTSTEKNKLSGISVGANNYIHPSSHPASIITQDANNRFVTDVEKATWNGKQNALGFTPIQQGTGVGQLSNTVKIGWSGNRVKVTVDATDMGNIAFGDIPTSMPAGSITAGALPSGVTATNGADYTTSRLRNMQASSTDLAAGSSSLANGALYIVYE